VLWWLGSSRADFQAARISYQLIQRSRTQIYAAFEPVCIVEVFYQLTGYTRVFVPPGPALRIKRAREQV
jgi:hypothetical protein